MFNSELSSSTRSILFAKPFEKLETLHVAAACRCIYKRVDGHNFSLVPDDQFGGNKKQSPMDKEMEELLKVEIDERVRELQELQKDAKTDPLYQSMFREMDEVRNSVWVRVVNKNIPMTKENIAFIKSRIQEEFKTVEAKYARLERLRELQQKHGDLEHRLLHEKDKEDFAELMSIIEKDKENVLKEFEENDILRDFRATVKQRTGYDIKTDESQLSPEKIKEAFDFLDSPESEKILKHFNKVLNDDSLRAAGMDPDNGRPPGMEEEEAEAEAEAKRERRKEKKKEKENSATVENAEPSEQESKPIDKQALADQWSEAIKDAAENKPVRSNLFSETAMDNFKHLLRKELEKDPYTDQMFIKKFGQSLEEMIGEFEESLKSGKLLDRMSPQLIHETMKKAQELEKKMPKKE